MLSGRRGCSEACWGRRCCAASLAEVTSKSPRSNGTALGAWIATKRPIEQDDVVSRAKENFSAGQTTPDQLQQLSNLFGDISLEAEKVNILDWFGIVLLDRIMRIAYFGFKLHSCAAFDG